MTTSPQFRSAVTVSLVPEARGGPFIFWDDLPAAASKAKQLRFDALEIFAPSADALNESQLRHLLSDNGLALAALGTGAGWVRHRLTLTSPDASIRKRAREFVRSLIDLAAAFSASAIIGSMQGRFGDGLDRDTALHHLADALEELAEHANRRNVPLIFEPLNRYETNLVNTLADGVTLLQSIKATNVRLLADLFHMNIEEVDIPRAIRSAAPHIAHVHFADSNRRPADSGHTDLAAIAAALRDINFRGYISAEALPYPTPDDAALLTMMSFRRFFVD